MFKTTFAHEPVLAPPSLPTPTPAQYSCEQSHREGNYGSLLPSQGQEAREALEPQELFLSVNEAMKNALILLSPAGHS